MPKMTGGIKTGRFYVSLPKTAAEEIEGYVKESGMYRACFLSYALAVGTRVVERQRSNAETQQPLSQASVSNGLLAVKPEDFSRASDHEGVVARQKLVDLALERMTPEQRALMELAYFDGLSESQLAARLDLPVSSIRARMALALQHFDTLVNGERLA